MRQEIFFRRVVATGDTVALAVSYMAAYWIRDHLLGTRYGMLFPFAEYAWILWIIMVIWLFWLSTARLYDSGSYASAGRLIGKLAQVQCLAGMTLFSVIYMTRSWTVSRLLLQLFLVVSFLVLLAGKAGVKLLLDRLRTKRGPHLRKVLVVGADARAEKLFHLLSERPHWGAEAIGFLSPEVTASPRLCGKPVLGRPADFPTLLGEQVVDEVVVVSPWEYGVKLEGLAWTCAERGITFRVLAEMPSVPVGRYHAEELGKGLYFLSLETTPQDLLPLLAKRLLDVSGATVGLVLCGLTYLWYAPRLLRESPGPVLFRQTRVGQNGRRFTLHKFRTMGLDAEERVKDLLPNNEMRGSIFKIQNDPRVTASGSTLRRHYLDELPQCWNVLKGEMSLVGTRPPTPHEVARYRPPHYRRISMKPGVTGLWQLSGNATVSDFEDVVRLDCEYIDNWSLWLDCKILAKTVLKVLRGDGW